MQNYCRLFFVLGSILFFFSGCVTGQNRAFRAPGAISASGSLFVDSLERSYCFYVPCSYDKLKKTPLVLVLHGGRGTAKKIEQVMTWNQLAEDEGFLVVYPQGYERNWNDGRNVEQSPAHVENIDDVKFIGKLITKLSNDFNVDEKRVYLFGVSNGAMMSFRLAFEMSDRITAIAPVIGSIPENLAKKHYPSRPVPTLMINGSWDPLVPWDGGYVKFLGQKRGRVLSVPDSVKFWVKNNHCSKVPTISHIPDYDQSDGTRVNKYVYRSAKNHAPVILYKVIEGGHTWPGGPQYLGKWLIGKINNDIDTVEVVWDFFQQYSL